MTYTLQNDGDSVEKAFYATLIQVHFPSYEMFWQKFVIPLTNRPVDLQFKIDVQLAMIGKGPCDVCLAQLHYSTFRHLVRAFHLRNLAGFGLDHLVFSLSAIVGAQDVAFELLERFRNPTAYGPWLGKRSGRIDGGREAQRAWKNYDRFPLQDVRDYRNHLVHGRTPPGINNQYPMIGKEANYFDWRLVTSATTLPTHDFADATDIHDDAFNRTVAYFESKWGIELLPNI